MTIFTQMKTQTASILDKIYAHPFNQELERGELPQEIFMFYLRQDALYLEEYARALSLLAARLTESKHKLLFHQFALETVDAEQALHHQYLQQHGRDPSPNPLSTIEPTAACFMYTNYLLRTATLSPIEVGVAAVLPCFYIYLQVGQRMLMALRDDHPYHDWIALYSGEAFAKSVDSAVMVTNELAQNASDSLKQAMLKAYDTSAKLEWLFWQDAYHQVNWM